ncbi:MAG: SAM-dependent methyltransferase [Muribaculaceae bacterium]|nr:SAM-dependent methyltransferase [Muribaculaceae bacterium]
MSENTGRVILFPVPMGQTPPAQVLPASNIEMLRDVRHFVVENVRSARRFLRAAVRDFPIDDSSFVELSEHTPAADVAAMLEPALSGHDIGVVSEAGCPAVADPGSDLVAVAQRRGLEVVPLVGPSSIIMSLMASGFNGQHFTFMGYLPIEGETRRKTLRAMERRVRAERCTHIFIETPYRNNRLVAELAQTLAPDTLVCVAADITGPAQRIRTLTAAQWRKAEYNYDKTPAIFLIGQ